MSLEKHYFSGFDKKNIVLVNFLYFYLINNRRGGARSLSEIRQISLHWYAFVVIDNS